MPIPDDSPAVSLAELEACESTALFLAPARAVLPGFAAEGPDGAAVAAAVGSTACRSPLSWRPRGPSCCRRMAQTLVAYLDGPLTRPARIRGLPRPGTRMPDVTVGTADGERSLFAVLRSGRHVLLVGGEPPAGLMEYPDRVEVVRLSLGRSRGYVLVRTDGYVAAVGIGTNNAAVRNYLHDLVRPAVASAGPSSSNLVGAAEFVSGE